MRQASGQRSRRARSTSARMRTWSAPWLSSPVSESVRAASWARSKASAFWQAVAARSATASTSSMSSWVIQRRSRKATESAPRSSSFQRTGTATRGLDVGQMGVLGDLHVGLVGVGDRGLPGRRGPGRPLPRPAGSGSRAGLVDPVGRHRGPAPLAVAQVDPAMSAPTARLASRQSVSSTARRSRRAFRARAARASAVCCSAWAARRAFASSTISAAAACSARVRASSISRGVNERGAWLTSVKTSRTSLSRMTGTNSALARRSARPEPARARAPRGRRARAGGGAWRPRGRFPTGPLRWARGAGGPSRMRGP